MKKGNRNSYHKDYYLLKDEPDNSSTKTAGVLYESDFQWCGKIFEGVISKDFGVYIAICNNPEFNDYPEFELPKWAVEIIPRTTFDKI